MINVNERKCRLVKMASNKVIREGLPVEVPFELTNQRHLPSEINQLDLTKEKEKDG